MRATLLHPVSLEVAHIHAPDRLVRFEGYTADGERRWNGPDTDMTREFVRSMEGQVTERPEVAGGRITRLSLLDDVAARAEQKQSIDRWRWELFLGVSRESVERGTGSAVHFESAFVQRATQYGDTLAQRAQERAVPTDDSGRFVLSTAQGLVRVKLFGFKGVDDPSHPSCALLDLAWTAWRTEQFERTFTVIPLGYFKQQLQVAAIAALLELPRRESVTSIFVDRAGRVKGELHFGDVVLQCDGKGR